MLNELYELNESRQAAGIVTESWHKDYGTCPNYKTFSLLLGTDGTVVDLDPITDRQRIKSLRKWEISNGTSFPAFNVLPLLHAQPQAGKEVLDDLNKVLKGSGIIDEQMVSTKIDELCHKCEYLWNDTETNRINHCLQSHPEALKGILGKVSEDFRAIEELIRQSTLLNASMLCKSLKKVIIHHIVRSPADASSLVDTLLVTSAPKKESIKKVCLVLELADWSSFKYPANHAKVQGWINSRLMLHTVTTEYTNKRDAFGQPLTDAISEEKFPDASLPILGNVKLRAMNKESPCQKRYGRSDAHSFPTGALARQEMKDALEWLGDPSRRGKTWQDASGTCGFTKRDSRHVPVSGLLLAYPSVLSEDPPELAGQFAGEEDLFDPDGTRFEACAERVTSALSVIIQQHPETEIRVFILAKADKARTKVVVSKHYNAMKLINAAQTWKDGCRNIPATSLNIGTKDKPWWIAPLIPYPGQVVKCLNTAWLQEGTRTNTIHGIGMGEGFALLMEDGLAAQQVVERSLHLAISNTSALLLAIGHANHRRDGSFKLDKRHVEDARLLPSLLGLLLLKLRYTKGGYMHTAPFLVGQMLALADTLHKEYCQHVRKKDTPPQLIGNALMLTAMDNPEGSMARLLQRLMPYQAWANTAEGEDLGLAKWTLGQMGQVSNELARCEVLKRTNDADKAQMLLGYLARSESKVPSDLETNNTDAEAVND